MIQLAVCLVLSSAGILGLALAQGALRRAAIAAVCGLALLAALLAWPESAAIGALPKGQGAPADLAAVRSADRALKPLVEGLAPEEVPHPFAIHQFGTKRGTQVIKPPPPPLDPPALPVLPLVER